MKTRTIIMILILGATTLAIDGFSQGPEKQKRISASLSVARKNIYHHEVFEIQITIRAENLRLGSSFELLSLPLISSLEMRDYKTRPVTRSLRDSGILEEHVFTYDAYAASPGKLTLAPILRVGILTRQRSFFGSRMVETSHDIPITPTTLNVLPLPKAPRNFSGAVGEFEFETNIAPLDVAPGDIIKATIKISGHGEIKNVKPMAISPGRNFKVYKSTPLESTDEGMIAFEQVLIPQNTNATVLPVLEFIYFNPKTGRYVTKRRGPFKLSFHEQTSETVEYYRPVEDISSKKESSETRKAKDADKKVSHGGSSVGNFFNRLQEGTLFCKETAILTEAQARLAPSSSSLIMFEIPEGAVVMIISEYRNWTEVSWKNNRGWIPKRVLHQGHSMPNTENHISNN